MPGLNFGPSQPASSATFAQPAGIYQGPGPLQNIWNGIIDPLIHQGPFANTDFSGSPANAQTTSSNTPPSGGNQPQNTNSNPPQNNGGNQPPYAPNTQNQTVNFGGQTWKGNPGSGWQAVGNGGNNGNQGVQSISQDELNQAYDPIYSSINALRNTVMGGKQDFLNSVSSPFDTQRPNIDQALTQGQNLNQQQTAENQSQLQNALASARQLYNELSQGVMQRFGGVNSAGDFAKAFYGRELGKNEGQAYATEGENQRTLNTQSQTLLSQHDNNIKELNFQKDSALAQAQTAFNTQLQQIDQTKIATDQQKATAKLDALQKLKDTVNTINQSWTSLGQQMKSATQAGLIQLRNQVAYAKSFSGQPLDQATQNAIRYSSIGTPDAGNGNPYFAVGSNRNPDQNGNMITGNNRNPFAIQQGANMPLVNQRPQ